MSKPRSIRPRRSSRENPGRLRECLEALSKHREANVYRIELVCSPKSVKLLITCSPRVSEMAIAERIVTEFRPYLEILTGTDTGKETK